MTSATLTHLSLRASRPWPIQALRFLGTFLAAWFALELVVTSPPTLVHGLIGSWQLFERTYPVEFSMVMLAASLGVPMFVFLFGIASLPARRVDRRSTRPIRRKVHDI